MPFPRRLIVNADDFGLHCSLNDAVVQGYESGIVTSTSLMPGKEMAPAFTHALSLLRNHPGLDVGLHFTLVGAPGLPPDHTAFVKAKLAGQFPSSRVRTMLRRQIDTLIQSGIKPSHIDSHQHLHALPGIMRIVAETAQEYTISAVRLPQERGKYVGASKGRIGASKLLALLCIACRRELIRAKVKFPAHFVGMAISGSLSPAVLVQMVADLPEGDTEILCHPGVNNEELARVFPWKYDWECELAAVTDGAVRKALTDHNVQLISFRDL